MAFECDPPLDPQPFLSTTMSASGSIGHDDIDDDDDGKDDFGTDVVLDNRPLVNNNTPPTPTSLSGLPSMIASRHRRLMSSCSARNFSEYDLYSLRIDFPRDVRSVQADVASERQSSPPPLALFLLPSLR